MNGIGYDKNGNITYKLINNINGKGKEYYCHGKLEFEGEYLNGLKWNGRGNEIFNNIVYELNDGKGLKKEYDND